MIVYTPIELVLQRFKNTKEVAELLNITESTISQWKKRGGKIPLKYFYLLLKYAMYKNIPLTEIELVRGGI